MGIFLRVKRSSLDCTSLNLKYLLLLTVLALVKVLGSGKYTKGKVTLVCARNNKNLNWFVACQGKCLICVFFFLWRRTYCYHCTGSLHCDMNMVVQEKPFFIN